MEYTLGKENEFGDGTERTEDTSINTTHRDGNQHPLDIPMVLPPSLLQCSDTFRPPACPCARLEDGETAIELCITYHVCHPCHAVIKKKLVPLVERIGCEE